LLVFSKRSDLYDQIFCRKEFVIADANGQREVKEERIQYFRVYGVYGCEFRAGKINGFSKVHFMVEGIKKRGFEGLRVKVVSGEIEGMESFHSL